MKFRWICFLLEWEQIFTTPCSNCPASRQELLMLYWTWTSSLACDDLDCVTNTDRIMNIVDYQERLVWVERQIKGALSHWKKQWIWNSADINETAPWILLQQKVMKAHQSYLKSAGKRWTHIRQSKTLHPPSFEKISDGSRIGSPMHYQIYWQISGRLCNILALNNSSCRDHK